MNRAPRNSTPRPSWEQDDRFPWPSELLEMDAAEMVVKPNRQSEPDRVCSDDGCAVVLSRYNIHDRCALHDPRGTQRDRAAEMADEMGAGPLFGIRPAGPIPFRA